MTVTGLHSESSLRVSDQSFWRLLRGSLCRLLRAALRAPICSKPCGLAGETGEAMTAEARRAIYGMKDFMLNGICQGVSCQKGACQKSRRR